MGKESLVCSSEMEELQANTYSIENTHYT